MRNIHDEDEMEDRYYCVLIDFESWVATQMQGKSALPGLNPGVNLWSKLNEVLFDDHC